MEVATDTRLLQLDFVGAKQFTRTSHRIIDRFVEIVGVSNIGADFWRKEFRIEGRVLIARIAVEPGPIPVRERCDLFLFCRNRGRRIARRLRHHRLRRNRNRNRRPQNIRRSRRRHGQQRRVWHRCRRRRTPLQFRFEQFDAGLHGRQFFGNLGRIQWIDGTCCPCSGHIRGSFAEGHDFRRRTRFRSRLRMTVASRTSREHSQECRKECRTG